MADTAASSVNGTYVNQYSQPAELAASTPSAPSHAASASQSTAASATKADPQEIGWYFVEQYYTTLSKSPDRIHLFYSKKSQLVTGVEAEKVIPAVGAKAISEKIKSLEIQDCKVRVLNVDSQASFSNIVVQVIGEMSNKSEPHHKFVQTFVLAEQPNGYYVLNDIFRYLSSDDDEIVEDEVVQPEVTAAAEEETIESPATPEEVDEKTEDVQTQEPEPASVNGADTETLTAPEPEPASVNGADNETPAAPESEPESKPESEAVAPEVEEAVAVDESTTTEATEASVPAEDVAVEEPTKPVTPIPEVPTKKTWASMLGGGKAAAVPAIPTQPAAATTTTTATTAPTSIQPKSARAPQQQSQPQVVKPPTAVESVPTTSTGQSNGWQTADHGKKAKGGSIKAGEGTTLAYIKNVNEKVDARILREVLESFGELKYYDVSRPRNCAFVEYADPSGYAAAVAANPHTVGTEQIYVEERRPRPNAYGGSSASFGRGGGNGNTGAGRGRGNLPRTGSQGSFSKEASRGGMQQQQQRGSKTGNVTPKARGQGSVS